MGSLSGRGGFASADGFDVRDKFKQFFVQEEGYLLLIILTNQFMTKPIIINCFSLCLVSISIDYDFLNFLSPMSNVYVGTI